MLEAYKSVNERAPVSLDLFLALTECWDATPINVNGKPAGVLLIKGPELHACVAKWAHGLWVGKWLFRAIDKVVSQYGYAETRVRRGAVAGHEFVKRLKFERLREEGDVVIYRKVKHGH